MCVDQPNTEKGIEWNRDNRDCYTAKPVGHGSARLLFPCLARVKNQGGKILLRQGAGFLGSLEKAGFTPPGDLSRIICILQVFL